MLLPASHLSPPSRPHSGPRAPHGHPGPQLRPGDSPSSSLKPPDELWHSSEVSTCSHVHPTRTQRGAHRVYVTRVLLSEEPRLTNALPLTHVPPSSDCHTCLQYGVLVGLVHLPGQAAVGHGVVDDGLVGFAAGLLEELGACGNQARKCRINALRHVRQENQQFPTTKQWLG